MSVMYLVKSLFSRLYKKSSARIVEHGQNSTSCVSMVGQYAFDEDGYIQIWLDTPKNIAFFMMAKVLEDFLHVPSQII